MKFSKSISILGLLAVLAGCGGGSKVTEEQKAKFKELVKSTSSVIDSAKSAKAGGKSALATSPETDTLNARFAEKLNSGACKFQTPTADSMSSGISTINMKVDGAECPIFMEITASGTESAVNLKINFEIKDADLAALSDVTKMDLTGTIRMSGNSGSGSIDGFIQSKKYGRVGLQFNVSGNENSNKLEVIYSFTDFKISLGVEQSSGGVKYSINGSEVSAEDFRSFVEGGSILPGASSPQLSGTAGSTPTTPPTGTNTTDLSYNLTYNGCSTEQQSFTSQAAMCEGLQSDARNHSCAEDLRRSYFTSHGCPGVFTPAP